MNCFPQRSRLGILGDVTIQLTKCAKVGPGQGGMRKSKHKNNRGSEHPSNHDHPKVHRTIMSNQVGSTFLRSAHQGQKLFQGLTTSQIRQETFPRQTQPAEDPRLAAFLGPAQQRIIPGAVDILPTPGIILLKHHPPEDLQKTPGWGQDERNEKE